jgi:bifunctional non-homologous end joining protein LigD
MATSTIFNFIYDVRSIPAVQTLVGGYSCREAFSPSSSDAWRKWLHEIKYDGYRLQIHLNKGARIFTRNGHDWTNRFPVIADAFDIPVERAIFDGEVVVVHEGRTNFSELQSDLASGKQRRMVYYAFDLLYLEGFDLRKSPQVERKRVLKMLFDETKLKSPSSTASTC